MSDLNIIIFGALTALAEHRHMGVEWPSRSFPGSRQAVRVGGGWPGASWQGGGTGCSCAGRDPSTS
ncbi:protein of unknown function [Micropruina glycogenica]|uniref:Uncharacterized protein n=1 Tax=Micropruina glycogenica TaxID=75385 RepID=A0A2N9JCR1_9ACTN|nr:protein of unknown function [Micropruina glycogenica]